MIAVALVSAVLLAYIPVTFQGVVTTDSNGNEIQLKGFDAIHWFQEHDILKGELTAEKIAYAVDQRQAVYREYDSEYGENIPALDYYKRVWPYNAVSRCSVEVMADNETGLAPKYQDIDSSELANYYDRLEDRLAFVLRSDNDKNEAAVKSGLDKFSKVEKPYFYCYGVDTNNMDYEILLFMVLTLICAFICSTVFSSDSQTKANDIQFCTKHGTLRHSLIKIIASSLICSALFVACSGIFITLTGKFFGKESLATSVQALYSVTSLPDWNMGEMMWGIMWCSLLLVGCTVAFIFVVSAFCSKNATAVCISLLSVIAPIITYMALPEKIEKWVQCFMPSGGIGTSNSILYMFINFDFLPVGNKAFWNAEAILVISAVEIIVFITLTLFVSKRRACGKA
ncbi:MAG: ABC transporter permease [Eubacteriales bacterium]|nr:ABC transporter permease [Eubacteriales bacterium]